MGFFKITGGDKTFLYGAENHIPILEIAPNWHFEVMLSKKTEWSSRLRIKTAQSSEVIIPLPSLPQQKWVFIAIIREGRRFDVIYNNRIVASQLLEHYPDNQTGSLSVGNERIRGNVIHVIVNAIHMTPTEIEQQRLKYVDSNDVVIEDNVFAMSLPEPQLTAECPSGFPCTAVTHPPRDRLLRWTF